MVAMRSMVSVVCAVVAVAAGLIFEASTAAARACTQQEFEGSAYVVCAIDPVAADLRLFWKAPDGEPFRSFSNVAEAVSGEGRELVFAINGGMYLPDFTPLGLFVENGATLRPADTGTVEGPPARVPNFYKKPNGVFFLGETAAGILTTEDYLVSDRDVRFATQSGPLLVIDGDLHPMFIPGSTDRTRRSGVGVCEDGLVRFAISEGRVNFHDFARLFRDRLGCDDALFLDGGRGAGLYLPEMGRNNWSWYGGYGPIFGLVD